MASATVRVGDRETSWMRLHILRAMCGGRNMNRTIVTPACHVPALLRCDVTTPWKQPNTT